MGLFKKKEKKGVIQETPILPELPELPEIPQLGKKTKYRGPIPQLPSFPNNSLGEKFSQNSIKEAVKGEKEEFGEADEFALDDRDAMRRMPSPKQKIKTRELPYPEETFKPRPRIERQERFVKKEEPIFVRIDKFEEGLKIFEKIKDEISQIEKILRETKKIKDEEEKELDSWENEIQSIKGQIEKIDKDIFSKIE